MSSVTDADNRIPVLLFAIDAVMLAESADTLQKLFDILCDTWLILRQVLVYPELKTHINYVFKIRNGTYWAVRRYAKSGIIKKRFSDECLLSLRADILAQYINICRVQVATKPPLLPSSISVRLVGKLLGEKLKFLSTRIRKDPTVL
ncbi:hypothetical protein BB561_005253 [Smittium simulii]|uniref:Uncharacterized protein n=1 Tax=Smittium simulii TaxID=133385 RepID=A0A2T9YBB8_9FUNG|nr:hypothetical protein BB561_005253 [Smittium simulii]